MSRYLVDRVIAHPKITVLTSTRLIAAGAQPRLENVTVVNRDGQRRELRADAMYVLIGGQPLTAGVEGWLRRDGGGYLMTGPDLHRHTRTKWWPLAREPLPLESSQPGRRRRSPRLNQARRLRRGRRRDGDRIAAHLPRPTHRRSRAHAIALPIELESRTANDTVVASAWH